MATGKRRGFWRAFALAEGEGYGRNPACGVPSAGLRPNSRASSEQKACCPCAPVRIIISIRTWGRALFGARPHVLAEGEGFEPPDPCRSSVFKFYFLFVFFRLLLLFNRPNYRKISVLTALLSDNPGFLLCFGIVPCSLSLLIFSTFLTAFCRDFVDCFAWIKKFICCFILFLFLTNTRRGAKQIFAYQSNQESV